MPKVILFELTSRVFVFDSQDGFKVYFEDIPCVFTHNSTKAFKCSCEKKNCIHMGFDIANLTKIHLQGIPESCDLANS